MKHPAAERWADLAAGKLAAAEAERMVAHAAGCAACAAKQARVATARAALRRVAEAAPPSLGWDLLGARLYWSTSSEIRRRQRTREGRRTRLRRLVPFAAVGLTLASGVAAVFLAAGRRPDAPPPHLAAAPAASAASAASTTTTLPIAVVPTPAPAPAPAALDSAVTFLQGDVTVGAARATAATAIAAGDVIVTGRGRLAVQFGRDTGLLVEPDSVVKVEVFDAARVQLRVTGAVTVELERRAPGQSFAVLAGTRRVEVRGTVFRVAERAGDLDVAVTRGKVEVIEDEASLEVAAGMHLALAASAHLDSIVPAKVLRAANRELAEGMRVPLVTPGGPPPGAPPGAPPGVPPGVDDRWPGGAALRDASSMLSVSASPRTRVAVDDRPIGSGSFALRVTPGVHVISAGGIVRRVDVAAGADETVVALAPGAPVTERATSERPAQFDAELSALHAAVDRCGENARKASPGQGGDVGVEIGINADGTVDFVRTVRGSGDREVDGCFLDLIRDHFTFPRGSRATVQKTIHF